MPRWTWPGSCWKERVFCRWMACSIS
jgi:hypothetical protein